MHCFSIQVRGKDNTPVHCARSVRHELIDPHASRVWAQVSSPNTLELLQECFESPCVRKENSVLHLPPSAVHRSNEENAYICFSSSYGGDAVLSTSSVFVRLRALLLFPHRKGRTTRVVQVRRPRSRMRGIISVMPPVTIIVVPRTVSVSEMFVLLGRAWVGVHSLITKHSRIALQTLVLAFKTLIDDQHAHPRVVQFEHFLAPSSVLPHPLKRRFRRLTYVRGTPASAPLVYTGTSTPSRRYFQLPLPPYE